MGWRLDGGGVFLAYFAVAGAVQHITFLFLLLLAGWQYPQGMSAPMLTGLTTLYFLKPLLWIAGQALLMLLMWLHRRYLSRDDVLLFSPLQLQGVWLISLLFQVACFAEDEKICLFLWLLCVFCFKIYRLNCAQSIAVVARGGFFLDKYKKIGCASCMGLAEPVLKKNTAIFNGGFSWKHKPITTR